MPADPTRPPVPLDRIEAAAEKAQSGYPNGSPGPWTVVEGTITGGDLAPGVWSEAARDAVAVDLTAADAEHIALCDPPTIKALTAALRRQDAALERIAWALDDDDPVVVACDAMAEVRAAVSFSPTGGAEDG